jgi:hypothetical protein
MPLAKKKKEQKAVIIKNKTKAAQSSQISKVKPRGRPSKSKSTEIQELKVYIEQSRRSLIKLRKKFPKN